MAIQSWGLVEKARTADAPAAARAKSVPGPSTKWSWNPRREEGEAAMSKGTKLILAAMLLASPVALRLAPVAPSPAAETKSSKPNILFIIADDASHFGATGCSWVNTPHIDRLAGAG